MGTRSSQSLYGFEELENFGVGPVGGADEAAADFALAVDDEGFWPAGSAVFCGGGLLGVPYGFEIDVAIDEETFVGVLVFVDADADDLDLGVFVVELEERGQLLNAGGAPACPEIQKDDLAFVAGQVDGAGIVSEGKVGGWFANAGGVGAAIAGGGHEEQTECRDEGCFANSMKECHKPIIRSGGDRWHGRGIVRTEECRFGF